VSQPTVQRPGAGGSEARYLAVAAAGLLVLLLVVYELGQLVLPVIAAGRIRDSLVSHASGVRVSVTATPALELLFGHADRVTVHIDQLYPLRNRAKLGGLFARMGGTDDLDASVEHVVVGGVALQHIVLTKRGAQLMGKATVTRAAIEAALPLELQIAERNPNPQTLLLSASTNVLGHTVAGTAIVTVEDGRLVIAPDNPLLGFLHLTLFDDPRVEVQTVSARSDGEAYTFAATGRFQ